MELRTPAYAMSSPHDHPACQAVERWLETAVIGLNLCPFARAVQVKGQIRWVVVAGTDDAEAIRTTVDAELLHLAQTDPDITDTTLIVVPDALSDFFEFSRFVDSLTASLKRKKLRGVLQIAAFHPHFEFASEPPDAVSHYTNRSPFPVIHLLREDSMARALERFGDADRIWQANVARLGGLSAAVLEQVFPYGNWPTKP